MFTTESESLPVCATNQQTELCSMLSIVIVCEMSSNNNAVVITQHRCTYDAM